MDIELKELQEGFDQLCYIVSEEHLNTIYLALRLERPLLISGPAGAGKTEMAKSLSEILGAKLIRLQCHGGLDENKSLYEWNIQRQLLNINRDSREVFTALLKEGVIIRTGDIFDYPNYIRVTVGTPEQNNRFIVCLEKVMKELA
jgi:MoxR-like ATPase